VRTIVKGKNIDVPKPVRLYAERKMRRLERFLDDRSEAVVELSTEQHHSGAASQIAEVTLVVDGLPMRSHAAGPTHQASLDIVVDKIERQAVDHRDKLHGKVKLDASQARFPAEGEPPAPHTAESEPAEAVEPRRSRIVKTKRFAIEPMFEEDAVARMEELGHVFFLFVNAETERVCVVYKRVSGDYGLIEPVIAGEYMPGRVGHKAG
jgi:putative sigma-54 modulation protein